MLLTETLYCFSYHNSICSQKYTYSHAWLHVSFSIKNKHVLFNEMKIHAHPIEFFLLLLKCCERDILLNSLCNVISDWMSVRGRMNIFATQKNKLLNQISTHE